MNKNDDITRNIIISASALIPSVGGPLSYILEKTIPEYITANYNSLILDLENELFEINNKINIEFVESQEFISLCYKTIKYASLEIHNGKRQAFKNILISSLVSPPNFSMTDYFLRLLFDLSEIQFELLLYYYYADKNQEQVEGASSLMKRFPDVDMLIMSVISELNRLRLIRGAQITSLGKRFCDYINNPKDILPIILEEHHR